jgi:hypothetical protein
MCLLNVRNRGKIMNKNKIIFCSLLLLIIVGCSHKKIELLKITQKSITLYPIVQNGKWGYIDKTGKIVIEPQFDYAYKFFEGLARVKVGDEKTGKYGYLDTIGRFVVNPQFDDAGEFSEGLSWVRIGNIETGKYGFINNNGKFVISPQFYKVSDFSEGFAAVVIYGKYYYINKRGEIVFPQRKYSHIRIGSEIKTNIIEQGFDDAGFFSEGLAAVKTGEKWGYIDKKSRFVINPQFDYANDFSDSLALVKISEKYGYINKHGIYVINPQFDYGGRIKHIPSFKELVIIQNRKSNNNGFVEGLSVVAVNDGEILKFGYINKSGKFIINPQFDNAGNFIEGLAAVKVNGKWGYIDKTGEFVINPTFDLVNDFYEGLAQVRTIDSLRLDNAKVKRTVLHYNISSEQVIERYKEKYVAKYGYIDKTGKYIWQPTR